MPSVCLNRSPVHNGGIHLGKDEAAYAKAKNKGTALLEKKDADSRSPSLSPAQCSVRRDATLSPRQTPVTPRKEVSRARLVAGVFISKGDHDPKKHSS